MGSLFLREVGITARTHLTFTSDPAPCTDLNTDPCDGSYESRNHKTVKGGKALKDHRVQH